MNGKNLYKSDEKMILGFCAGVAEYFDIDPTIVRLVWVILFFAYGVGALAYLVSAFIIPER